MDTKEIEDCYNDLKQSITEKELNINKSNLSNINESKNIESNIKILTYIWKSKMLISGYYEFEILFTKKDTSKNKILAQRTMYRSYHDIEILYQGLILYNPGCLIPKIPEKTFWENNKDIVEDPDEILFKNNDKKKEDVKNEEEELLSSDSDKNSFDEKEYKNVLYGQYLKDKIKRIKI